MTRARGRLARITTVVAPLTVAALVSTACGGGDDDVLKGAEHQAVGVNDINPQDPSTLRDGGDLRWPLDQLPTNFNRNHVSGTTGYAKRVMDGLMPHAFRANADNTLEVDKDYFDSIELTSLDPQVVTYRISSKATWDDGTPITWEDLKAQVEALNGANRDYQAGSTGGYRDVASVERGTDDREARVTFRKHYGEWRALFTDLYPKSTNSDPQVFNKGWVDRPLVTAGPFRMESVDRTAKTITLVRNERWWGAKPRLDRIIFRALERGSWPEALQNNEIDFYEIGSNVDLYQRAKEMPEVQVRQALEPKYNTVLFNGAPSSVLADQRTRLAVQKAINREAMTNALVGQILPGAKPLGNHMYVQGQKEYRDHSGLVPFDPGQAKTELDELGWRQDGDVRTKDGKELVVRFVIPATNPTSQQMAKMTQEQLRQVGVKLEIQPVPSQEFIKNYLEPGNFDLIGIGWEATAFPVDSNHPIFYLSPDQRQQNYGQVGNDTINAMFDEASAELDDARRAELVNRIDEEVWKSGHSLPAYQAPGGVAARRSLANFGARGVADLDYARIGFTG
ncbi:ABC transporter substrate-binding protein [Longimycelium tulufanense]|uniref:ABC transporter substrate-binding protein n=1 Tax=Longimycelium tulufanense TaxID=907463 RepID=A0A8J3CBI0_9PSEU|nr:ABC transporter family substrate-binding protein [Longimycelium tulufanense]GGM41947.1 ABC transporter substrate-binding protein [Longimycelium tulufanense]